MTHSLVRLVQVETANLTVLTNCSESYTVRPPS